MAIASAEAFLFLAAVLAQAAAEDGLNMDVRAVRVPTAWNNCSRSCGGGILTRTVLCYSRSLGIYLENEQPCSSLPRMPNVRSCQIHPCDPSPVAGVEAVFVIDLVALEVIVEDDQRADFEQEFRMWIASGSEVAVDRVVVLSIAAQPIRVLFRIDDANTGVTNVDDAQVRMNVLVRKFGEERNALKQMPFAEKYMKVAWLEDFMHMPASTTAKPTETPFLARFTLWELAGAGGGAVALLLSCSLCCWHCCKPTPKLAKAQMLAPNKLPMKAEQKSSIAEARQNGAGAYNHMKEPKVYPEATTVIEIMKETHRIRAAAVHHMSATAPARYGQSHGLRASAWVAPSALALEDADSAQLALPAPGGSDALALVPFETGGHPSTARMVHTF